MKTLQEDISIIKKQSKKILAVLGVLFIFAAIYIYNTTYYIIIRFDELGPLVKNMPAYYNGFKIGKIVAINPDKDFKHILVKVNLKEKSLKLPQNTIVYVERFPSGGLYLQFSYPASPSLNPLRRGDLLEGVAPYNVEQFMMGQSVSGMTDVVSVHIVKALNSADATNQEVKLFFKLATTLIEQNSKAINKSVNNTSDMTKNLAQMAQNLNQVSKKLNNAIDETELKSTTSNIKDTTENIAKATNDIDKTVKKIDDTIVQVNETAQNLNSITSGLNNTLSKRFAGIRIIFGKPVKQNCDIRNACKCN